MAASTASYRLKQDPDMLIAGNPSLQWVWLNGGLTTVVSVAHTPAAQERFHQDAGERWSSAEIRVRHGE